MRPYWHPRALYAEVHTVFQNLLERMMSYITSGLGFHTRGSKQYSQVIP